MHDWIDDYELDEHGRLRKKRVLPDGAAMRVPMGFYDGCFVDHFSDGTPDHTSPHRKGFRFADVDDGARLAADAAYEAMRERMSNAWRNKGEPRPDAGDSATPPRTRTLDELRAAADQAWQDRSKRMSNAWRNRHD